MKRINKKEIMEAINELGRIISELQKINKREAACLSEKVRFIKADVRNFRRDRKIPSSERLTQSQGKELRNLIDQQFKLESQLEQLSEKGRLDLLAEKTFIDKKELVKIEAPSQYRWEFSEHLSSLLNFVSAYKKIKRRKLTLEDLELLLGSGSVSTPSPNLIFRPAKLKQFNAVSSLSDSCSSYRRAAFWFKAYLAPYAGEINKKNIKDWKKAYNKAFFQSSLFEENTLTLKEVKLLIDKMSSLSSSETEYLEKEFKIFSLPFEEAEALLKGGKKSIVELIAKHQSEKTVRQVEELIENELDKEFELSEDGVCNLQIPSIQKEGISLRLVDAKDPLQVALGEITHCCQTHGGAGEAAMIEGIINPDSGFVVYEAAGSIIGQSWIWADQKGRIVFDSIEMANGGNPNKILPILQDLADRIGQSIVIGMDHSSLSLEKSKEEAPLMKQPLWTEFYTDTEDKFGVLYPNN